MRHDAIICCMAHSWVGLFEVCTFTTKSQVSLEPHLRVEFVSFEPHACVAAHGGDMTQNIWISILDSLPVHSFE